MIVKIVTLFLIFIAVLGMFGKMHWLGLPNIKRNGAIPTAKKCKTCGSILFKGVDCKCRTKTKS